MTPKTKRIVLTALDAEYSSMLSENHRLWRWFFKLSPQEMQEEYRGSGKTRQAVLDEHDTRTRALAAAIKEVKTL
jgi:hypothetical protein